MATAVVALCLVAPGCELRGTRVDARAREPGRAQAGRAEAPRQRALVDARGRLAVTCPNGVADVYLCPALERDGRSDFAPAGDGRYLGRTPVAERLVPEGSYLLRLRVEGRVETRLPLLVRRAAVQETREVTRDVPVYTRAELGEGWCFVPGGFSLIGEGRDARREWVGSFFVLERELTEAGYESLRDAGFSREVPPGAPRDVPLGGVLLQQALEYVDARNMRYEPDVVPRRYALPTLAQWQRAARGADGRRFPWGDGERSQPSPALAQYDAAVAFEEGARPQDVSPFDVRDMSGSLAELCLEREHFTTTDRAKARIAGGSRAARSLGELRVDRVRRDAAPELVGFRPVATAVAPADAAELDGVAQFEDAFDGRATRGRDLGRGWRSGPYDVTSDPDPSHVRVEDGELRLDGFAGSFSPLVLAYRRVDVDPGGFRLRLRVRVEVRSLRRAGGRSIGAGLWLARRAPVLGGAALRVRWGSAGDLVLGADHSEVAARVEASGWRELELLVHRSRVELRAWPAEGPRPVAPTSRAWLAPGSAPFDHLVLGADNRAGVSAAFDDVRLE